jgi:hypothetical protein
MSGAESDEEAQAIDSLMTALPTVKFAFIFFMVTSSWTLLSILTAVVSDNMISTTGQQVEEMKIASDDEDRQEQKRELRKLFDSIGTEGDGLVRERDVTEFLKDKDNALITAKKCCVATRNVLSVLQTLAPDGQPVKMDDFVTCMLDVSKPVTEQSIMKIETLFKDQQRHVDEGCKSLGNKVDNFRNRIKGWHAGQAASGPSESGQKSDLAALDNSAMAAMAGLVEQQKKNSEGIAKLHESVQALLRSQEALRQQHIFNNSRKAKLEADLSALEQRNLSSFSDLQDSVQALKDDLNMISMVPSSPSNENPLQPVARRVTGVDGPSATVVAANGERPVIQAPVPRTPDKDLRRLLALRGEAKLCNLPGRLADSNGSPEGMRTGFSSTAVLRRHDGSQSGAPQDRTEPVF